MSYIKIKIDSITKKFNDLIALNKISDEFNSGIIHGVIGPEGAGKTTLLRTINHLYRANNGRIDFFKDNTPSDYTSLKSKISYMPQRQSLYADLSIEEHLLFFKNLYQVSNETFDKKIKGLLEITRLEKFLDRPAGKLSGGMYKKLGLILSLIPDPEILLLDEPTNGVDPISRREFWDLLFQLKSEKILIIYTTAYMDEAERCDHVHLLNEGTLIGQGTPVDLLKNSGAKNFDEFYLKGFKND